MIPYNSLVLLVTPKGKRSIKRLQEGEVWQSHDGIITPETVAEADFGQVVYTNTGRPVQLLRVELFDLLKGIKRQTQIVYPKDVAYICMKLGVGPGRTICEAGCGSGGLTLAFSWFSGPTGRVVSHDAREEFAKLARRNLDWAGIGDNVEINVRDVAEGFCLRDAEADALFLDVRTPWEYLDQALRVVKPGAPFGFLLPTVGQVSELLKAMETRPFDHVEVQELLVRDWKPLADRLRPNDRMVAHTSFLVFARRQERNRDFDDLRPMGTRELKQKRALEDRLGVLD